MKNNCTYFVCSDIHSGYVQWIKALNDAGFDKNNENHKIIVCGDLFDRLSETVKVYQFAKEMVDNGKMIYVKGNHETLLRIAVEEILSGDAPSYYHFSNGTINTIAHFCDMSIYDFTTHLSNHTIKHIKKVMMPILKWIDEVAVDYMELENYIFVHSWIPTNIVYKDTSKMSHTRIKEYTYNPDWRNASKSEWEDSRWGNPFEMARQGLNQTGKIIVFGHFHTSYEWAKTIGCSEFYRDANFDPYYGDGFIGIDACVAHTCRCNVILIEDREV
jgi:serine/threonine protein phosphatase 1